LSRIAGDATLVDIGVNLTHRSFAGDLPAVLERAREAGVGMMIVTGTSVAASEAASTLARAHADVLFATAGVHPHRASDFDAAAGDGLRRLATAEEVVAVGECGLDYNRDFSPREDQRRCFRAQIELAAELGRPLFLHERDAGREFREILAPQRDRVRGGVVHCFTGEAADLDAYLDLDLHIGITGWICDERRGLHLRDLVRRIPADRLMLETDAPYLVPRTMTPRPRGRRNEPAFLVWVLEAVAQAVGRPVADVARETTHTARCFFGLALGGS
jgi:TatD DNase family protein